MSTSEKARLEMHLGLKNSLGERVAEIVMEHLPPAGWSDLARKSDLDHFAALTGARFDQVESRLEGIDRRLNGLAAGMWAMGTISSASFIALFTVLATKF